MQLGNSVKFSSLLPLFLHLACRTVCQRCRRKCVFLFFREFLKCILTVYMHN